MLLNANKKQEECEHRAVGFCGSCEVSELGGSVLDIFGTGCGQPPASFSSRTLARLRIPSGEALVVRAQATQPQAIQPSSLELDFEKTTVTFKSQHRNNKYRQSSILSQVTLVYKGNNS